MGRNRIELALEMAAQAHSNQLRKGTDIPYISHPYAVGILLVQARCAEEEILAGILHDTVEDTTVTLEQIELNFGGKVAALVKECSEPDKSMTWDERKKHTIESLLTAAPEVKRVVCADKLHNIRCIAGDYEQVGDKLWERFKRGREDQKSYYLGLVESLCDHGMENNCPILFEAFRKEVEVFFSLTAVDET